MDSCCFCLLPSFSQRSICCKFENTYRSEITISSILCALKMFFSLVLLLIVTISLCVKCQRDRTNSATFVSSCPISFFLFANSSSTSTSFLDLVCNSSSICRDCSEKYADERVFSISLLEKNMDWNKIAILRDILTLTPFSALSCSNWLILLSATVNLCVSSSIWSRYATDVSSASFPLFFSSFSNSYWNTRWRRVCVAKPSEVPFCIRWGITRCTFQVSSSLVNFVTLASASCNLDSSALVFSCSFSVDAWKVGFKFVCNISGGWKQQRKIRPKTFPKSKFKSPRPHPD